ncbi:MAG: transposase [Actinomycetota bacterium]|nr:transposase [Actinomycetota bacterium]
MRLQVRGFHWDLSGKYQGAIGSGEPYALPVRAWRVPAYRARWYIPVSLSTIERTFRVFRQAIYDAAVEELSSLRLSGELTMRGKHERVTHKRDEYVRGGVHLNGIEGFWSYAKTWLYHYRGVPREYFSLYLKEIEFRFNHREEDLFPLVADLL